tara:strand:+ start:1876 stop:2997 length:1122 start_codon:yes stop_codon:yes gene_type:complete
MKYFNKKNDMLSFLMAYNRKFIQKDRQEITDTSIFVQVRGNILANNILRKIYYYFKNPTFAINETIKDYIKLDNSTMLIATDRDFVLYSTKTKQEIVRKNINLTINESHGIISISTSYPFDKMIRLTNNLIAFSIVSRSQSVHIFDISQFKVVNSFSDNMGQNYTSILKKTTNRLITASPKKYFMTYPISKLGTPLVNTQKYHNHLYTPIDCVSFADNVFIVDIDNNIKLYKDQLFDDTLKHHLIETYSYKITDIIKTNYIAISPTTVLAIEATNMFTFIDIVNKQVCYHYGYSKKLLDAPIQIERLSPTVIVVRNNRRLQLWDISGDFTSVSNPIQIRCIRDIKYHENIRNMKIVDNHIIVQSINEVKELGY